jgi:hypothetical protein
VTGSPKTPIDISDLIARDVRWALDALRAGLPDQAERILARSFEVYVLHREGETHRLAERSRGV